MTKVFSASDGDITVNVYDEDSKHRIELGYEQDGKIVNTRLKYADHERGAALRREAIQWIQEQDKEEGKEREAEKEGKRPKDWTKGLKYGQRIREKAGREP